MKESTILTYQTLKPYFKSVSWVIWKTSSSILKSALSDRTLGVMSEFQSYSGSTRQEQITVIKPAGDEGMQTSFQRLPPKERVIVWEYS